MINTVATLDTIGLYKDFSSLDSILLEHVLNNKSDYFQITQSKSNNRVEYVLENHLRKSIFEYGIENIKLFRSRKTNNFFRFYIQFNAKLLGNDYLKGISKYNIKFILKSILRTIEPYFKINFDDFKSFSVGLIDYTKNLVIDSAYSISDVLKSIEYYSNTSRSIKNVNSRFLEEGTLTYNLSNNEKMLVYNKFNELNKSDNKNFIEKFRSVLDQSKNMLRVETRIIGRKRIIKELELLKDDSEIINIFDVLNTSINIAYNRLFNCTKSLKDNLILNKINNFDSLEYKEIENLFIAQGIYTLCNNDLEYIKEFINHKSKSRQTYHNRLKKILHSKRLLEFYQSNSQKLDFRKILEYTLDKLKTA